MIEIIADLLRYGSSMEKKKEKKREYENITEVNYIYPERILRKLKFRPKFDILREIYRSYPWRIFFFLFFLYVYIFRANKNRQISNYIEFGIDEDKIFQEY